MDQEAVEKENQVGEKAAESQRKEVVREKSVDLERQRERGVDLEREVDLRMLLPRDTKLTERVSVRRSDLDF